MTEGAQMQLAAFHSLIKFIQQCNSVDTIELKQLAANTRECISGVKLLFEACLGHTHAPVRSAAVKAFVSFIGDNDDGQDAVKVLDKLAPNIIQVCKHASDDDVTPLQCLADLAKNHPNTLQAHLAPLFTLCVITIRDANKEQAYRHSSMEVITSLCQRAPYMVKERAANFISDILQSCLILMTELSDELKEWLTIDDVEEEDEEKSVGLGKSSLDRIACALNGKVIVPIFMTIANQLVVDSDWKKRHAALMGLSTIGEGCQLSMEPHIVTIVKTIVPLLNDPHHRVRYAACNALRQMSSDFAPTLQKKCHAAVLPALIQTVLDVKVPRVSAHAGAAIVNFSEDCQKTVISEYLPVLMNSLEQVLEQTFKSMLEQNKKLILEQVITTIASVADASEELFVDYCDKLVAPLKYILENSNPEDAKAKRLRGKTIECLSLIGLAVGAEKFQYIMRVRRPHY